MAPPSLETARLHLRQFREDDLEALARLNADERFMRFLGPVASREDSWRQMAMLLGHWQLRGYGFWAVEDKASGRLVGRIGLHNPEGWPGLEVGWALDPALWGRGLAPEGGRAALTVAFSRLGAERVISVIHPDNAASIRVALKLGGRFDHQAEVRGVGCGIYVYERAPTGGQDDR